ncbi:pyridoxal phosphate-dependent aminotransferase [Sporolactobacillus sp. CPB3-1]|uniref:cysteine-S-conjugate beta-lyase n=1 Tax=Sporolactobacillus mangiferae TaxID=2940498 RepID=A0ABT0MDK5_9BACL|nr:MalY/PatB family protein [Sporolactobacillus mangiferae]MCL1632956.1 pyridoxal phosphate-dependent aminotransferase [Sporolactobacillus mangiferae]
MGKVYDFDTPVRRRGTASVKWDEADRIFQGEQLTPLWVADMDFQVPDEVTNALERRVHHAVYGYTAISEDYLEAVKNWMRKRHHWAIEEKWICHSPGVVTALNLIVKGFTKKGDKVLIQPPVYPPFSQAVLNQERELVMNPLININGSYRMDFEDLEQKLSDPKVKMMILCSPHNPVGRVWTKDELNIVATLALKYNVLVISDEIHSDLVFKGRVHTPFAALSDEAAAHSIICTAPSKTFNLAGLQISNIIIANPEYRKNFLRQTHHFSLGEPNALGVVAAEAAYRFGENWLDQCITYIDGNVSYVSGFLKKNIPDFKWTPIEGTYLGWIDCRTTGLTKLQLQNFLIHKARLALNPGSSFGRNGTGFVRINLACSHRLLEEAMHRLQDAYMRAQTHTIHEQH